MFHLKVVYKDHVGGIDWFRLRKLFFFFAKYDNTPSLFTDIGSNLISNTIPKTYCAGVLSNEVCKTLAVKFCIAFQKYLSFLQS